VAAVREASATTVRKTSTGVTGSTYGPYPPHELTCKRTSVYRERAGTLDMTYVLRDRDCHMTNIHPHRGEGGLSHDGEKDLVGCQWVNIWAISTTKG